MCIRKVRGEEGVHEVEGQGGGKGRDIAGLGNELQGCHTDPAVGGRETETSENS